MMTEQNYLTLKKEGRDEFTEKKSRFVGYACPVKSEREALDFIEKIEKAHDDAKHNVYAYIVRENNTIRFSDNGEPSGTAGKPCLAVLQKENLQDVCVVVKRFFGGILLGTGGLVRAYTKAAKIAVDNAGIGLMCVCRVLKVTVDYNFVNKMNILLGETEVFDVSTEYGQNVEFTFTVRQENEESLEKKILNESNGRFKTERIKSIMRAV